MSIQAYMGRGKVRNLGETTLTPSVKSIANGAVATEVLAADTAAGTTAAPMRNYVLLVNNSDTDIYLGFGPLAADATVAAGLVLKAGGGWLELTPANGNLTYERISAIHGAGIAKSLNVLLGQTV